MARRSIHLRWHGRCSVCHRELGSGELTIFDDLQRELVCLTCSTGDARHDAMSRPARPRGRSRRAETAAERARVRALIADARAALDAARRAG